MGIIRKQAVQNTLINYLGAFFGSITRVLMALYLTKIQIGALGLLESVSGSFLSIMNLGFDQVLVRLFPKYRDPDKGHHGFLALGIFLSVIGSLVSCVFFFFFEDLFLNAEDDAAKWFRTFSFLVFPMIFFRILFKNIDGYVRMLFNTTAGVFLEAFLSKVILAVGLVGTSLNWMNFDHLTWVFAFSMCLPGLVIIVFALFKTKNLTLPSKDLINRSNSKEMTSYILFGILLGASNSIVFYIDSLMLAKMTTLEILGYYTIFSFAARLIIIPSRSLNRISNVVIAESWKDNDMDTILDIYKRSCLNQMIIGAYLLGIGWACMPPIFEMVPKLAEFAPYKMIFMYIGIGMLIDMSTGVNIGIIASSTKYRYNTYFNFGLAVVAFILNYFMIKEWGVIGGAAATMISLILLNIVRWWFILRVFGFQPFDGKFFIATLISCGFVFLTFYELPIENQLLLLSVSFVGYSVLFWLLIVQLKLSEDINQWINKIFRRK